MILPGGLNPRKDGFHRDLAQSSPRGREREGTRLYRRAPSREEQRRRLESRAADDPEAIERRLARAEAEEEIARERFDAVIVNDDVDRAAAELAAIVEARREELR